MPQLCEAIVANQTPYVDTVSDCDVLVIGMALPAPPATTFPA